MYLYIIGQYRNDRIRGPVKVGIASAPWSRVTALQTGSPTPIAIYMAIHTDSRDTALAVERRMHERLAEHRMVGEWFDVNPASALGCLLDLLDDNETTFPIQRADCLSDVALLVDGGCL
jgi:hypothetical protein